MLPFSSFEFFLIMFAYIALAALCKHFSNYINYRSVLFLLNASFLLIIYPKPWHFLLLILYSYSATYLVTEVFRFKNKIYGVLLLLLPMLLVKAGFRFSFYPFELNNLISFAGLSYASFRIMSYYMDRVPAEPFAPFPSYFNYLSFTPTLLIGPIDRYGHFKESEDNAFRAITYPNFIIGWNSLIKGVVFKYIFAEITDRYWLNGSTGSGSTLIHFISDMYAYYVYLFFDFAGYSFMALGIGKMMGMEVPANFSNPFIALNPQDFWRRFHISLGDWLRDYFFTPLYKFFTRKKGLKPYPLLRQNTALILTFLLMGLWNGFYLNYILSGLLFGTYSAVHNTYAAKCKKAGKDVVFADLNPVIVRTVSIIIMFNLAAIALYIFSGRCPMPGHEIQF